MTDSDAVFRVEKIGAPLRYSITESIRNAIASGRFKAGDRLPERELCELTGVSRTLVREAMRQLESERSEEHTSELLSLMRISYAVFCLKKKTNTTSILTYSDPSRT